MYSIITVGGSPGSGKGTVSKLLAKQLGYTYISGSAPWRAKAEELGFTLNQMHEWCAKNPQFDYDIDNWIGREGRKGFTVVDSRMAFHMIPESLKIYLDVSLEEGARRIYEANRTNEKYNSIEEVLEEIKTRKQHEVEKHFQQSGVNVHNSTNFDIYIDTTKLPPQEVLRQILTNPMFTMQPVR